ncbi:MAG: sulfite exporter TauE/SafE family protein [Pseudomonadota bacterium]
MSEVFLIPAALLIGASAGFLGGLLGIGGGVIIVPALIIALELDGRFGVTDTTLVAVATSLCCVVGVSVSAAHAQLRRGNLDPALLKHLGPVLVLGAVLAAPVGEWLPPQAFRLLIGAFLCFVSLVMLTRWAPDPSRQLPKLPASGVLGVAGGLLSGLAGIGGGNVIVPTLAYFNVPMHRATANASALGIPIALSGALGYLVTGWTNEGLKLPTGSVGYIYLPAVVAVVLAAVPCAPLGVRAAQRLDAGPLRRLFGALLVVVSLRMIYSALSLAS